LPETHLFVLPAPWALFDPKANQAGYGRLRLAPTHPTRVSAGRPVYLAIPSRHEVRVSGYKMAAHALGMPYRLQDEDYTLYLLSVGVRQGESDLEIDVDGERAGVVSVDGYLPRPVFSAGSDNAEFSTARAELLDGFLLSIVNLIQMTSDPQYEIHQIVWERLQIAWNDEEAESTVPPVALIVRHAERCASMVRDLVEKPRHLLRRQRELTPVDRVQQLDVSCVRWLSRQPGRTVYERAGPHQRIMAVQRHGSLDTLENRVLKDFVDRSSREANRYTNACQRLKETARWNLVYRYGRRCHRAVSHLNDLDVSRLSPPVVPNFVLLQDVRYRHLWRAYMELLRRQDEEDECWRWQHRLWHDYVRLILHLSLRQADKFRPVAEAPLRINTEQTRGVWSLISSQSGTWFFRDEDGEEYILSLIWRVDSRHPKTHDWLSGLGCGSVLHVSRLSDSAEGYLPIWGFHGFGKNPEDIEELAKSCDRALGNVMLTRQLHHDETIRLHGIILLSDPHQDTIKMGVLPERQIKKFHKTEHVSAFRIGVFRRDIKSVARRLATSVPFYVRQLFSED
jgi:hypothetical protein